MKTYTANYRKMHPVSPKYTEEDLIEGLNQFFGRNDKFDKSFVGHTKTGGCYIDVAQLCLRLDSNEIKKIEKVTCKIKSNNISDAALCYSFNATDLIMSQYKRPEQKQ